MRRKELRAILPLHDGGKAFEAMEGWGSLRRRRRRRSVLEEELIGRKRSWREAYGSGGECGSISWGESGQRWFCWNRIYHTCSCCRHHPIRSTSLPLLHLALALSLPGVSVWEMWLIYIWLSWLVRIFHVFWVHMRIFHVNLVITRVPCPLNFLLNNTSLLCL